MLFRQALYHFVHLRTHLGGSRYFYLAAKAAHPAVELGADAYRHIKVKICTVFLRHEQRRFAKAVAHGAFQVGGAAQSDPVLRPAEHVEVLAQIGGQVELAELGLAPAGYW